MTSDSIPIEPDVAAAQLAEQKVRRCRKLDELSDIGMIHARAGLFRSEAPEASDATVLSFAKSYTFISRAVRQAIMLACKLEEPARIERPAGQRAAARARVIRGVEDAIEHKAFDAREAESLRVELLDRMDALEFEYDIETRSFDDIVVEICRDLGLGECSAGVSQWRRRTPEMVAALCSVAAEPSGKRARDTAAGVRIERPQMRVVDPDWDLPDPDKPLSEWSDAELDRAILRNPKPDG